MAGRANELLDDSAPVPYRRGGTRAASRRCADARALAPIASVQYCCTQSASPGAVIAHTHTSAMVSRLLRDPHSDVELVRVIAEDTIVRAEDD